MWGKTFVCFATLRCFMAVLSTSWHVPDETWQSVEVSHRLAFGSGYSTWEWETAAIRSYLHPLIFVPAQLFGDWLGKGNEELGRYLVVLLPKTTQAVMSAAGDASISLFCHKHLGQGVHRYFLSVYASSWFANYCLSRTLVNALEAALTSIALCLYPANSKQRQQWWRCLYAALAALCFVVRPTAALLWILPVLLHLWRSWRERSLTHFFPHVFAALATLTVCCAVDSRFYGSFTFVPLNFFVHNVLNDVGSFYGVHRPEWYLTSGLPVVMGGYGVFPLIQGLRRRWDDEVLGVFAKTVVVAVFFLSLVPHKEFRFLLPVLPLCWCFVADYLHTKKNWVSPAVLATVTWLVFGPACWYLSRMHQSGTVAAVDWLGSSTDPDSSVLFLMPCHSMPLRSHLHGRDDLRLRFLTCEPDLGGTGEVEDEADVFYSDPASWLDSEFGQDSDFPNYLVMFGGLVEGVKQFLQRGEYTRCAEFFHTHFPKGRVTESVEIFCRKSIVYP